MEFDAKDRREEGATPLRQAQLAELYILDIFDAICKKHGLTYFLAGGALLGAMRHGGFIPWDDDIDVAMPIDDYRRFLKIAEKDLPSNLLLVPGSEYSGRHPMGKIYDRTSFFCEVDTDVRYPCGIYIDIFPQSKQPAVSRRFGAWMMRTAGLAWISRREHLTLHHHSVSGILISWMKACVWTCIYWGIVGLSTILGFFLPTRWHDPLGFLTRYYHDGFTDDDLFPTGTVVFEGKIYSAPRNIEHYLTSLYNDWRELPPPEKREWHASIICPTQAPDAKWSRPYGSVVSALAAVCLALVALPSAAAKPDIKTDLPTNRVVTAGWVNIDDAHHLSGPKLTPEELNQRIVVVQRWCTKCPHVLPAVQEFQRLAKRFPDPKFVFLSSYYPDADQTREEVETALRKLKVTGSVYVGASVQKMKISREHRALYVVENGKTEKWSVRCDNTDIKGLTKYLLGLGR